MDALDVAIWAVVAPLVVGLVHIARQAGLPARWAGIAALMSGVSCGVLVRMAGVGAGSLGLAALTGAVAGLSAAGVWSGARAATRG